MPQSAAATASNDEKLVLETIGTYLKALHKADKGLFLKAFAETANVSYVSIADEKLDVLTLPKFLELVDSLHKTHGNVEEFHTNPIVTVAGPVASVLVPFSLNLGSNKPTGTDVFALARVGGTWKITSKLYSM
jgi:hypothetical protein